MEIALFAFDTPWFSALTYDVMFVEIARPAASSAALLMRLPEERRLIAEDSALCEPDRFFWVVCDSVLVLMFNMALIPSFRVWWPFRHVSYGVAPLSVCCSDRLTWVFGPLEKNFRDRFDFCLMEK